MSKKSVAVSVAVLALAVAWLNLSARPAGAVKAFKDQFGAKYVKPDSKDPNDAALAQAFQQTGCNVCHAGESKKHRNPYGQALEKLLSKRDAKDTKKIQAALDKASAVKSNPSDPKSPTFGEIIAKGKLPAAP
jgi:hypothetical protein